MSFPYTALVGQASMRLALELAAIDPGIGGVLVLGDRGTGKTTAMRALAALLPPIEAHAGCRYNCDPDRPDAWCAECSARAASGELERESRPTPVVDLPLGASEDRVVGALDIERALTVGEKRFEPGLLATAHRGFLYVDEVNLLEDHVVDLLLDVAVSGTNVVERDGLSVRHPARFLMIGSGNPEEGELRPQLLDRFGLSVDIRTPDDIDERIEIVRRRDAYERDPEGFAARWADEDARVRASILDARAALDAVEVPDAALRRIARLCLSLGTDGLRGELVTMRAARALAAIEDASAVDASHVGTVATMALRHRLRRDPLDDADSGARVERALAALDAGDGGGDGGSDDGAAAARTP